MRLITYRRDATIAPALLKDGHVFPLNQLGYSDTLAFMRPEDRRDGPGSLSSLKRPG